MSSRKAGGWILALITASAVGMLAAWSGWKLREAPAPTFTAQSAPIIAAPAFTLTDQDGQTLTNESLRGSVWIGAFIFTRCQGPCPRMTADMAALQSRLPAGVRLISISVDPDFDTPAVLKEYAKKVGADESRWRFLTGPRDQIVRLSRGLMLGLSDTGGEIVHSTRIVLVDREGKVRGYFDSADPAALGALVKAAAAAEEKA